MNSCVNLPSFPCHVYGAWPCSTFFPYSELAVLYIGFFGLGFGAAPADGSAWGWFDAILGETDKTTAQVSVKKRKRLRQGIIRTEQEVRGSDVLGGGERGLKGAFEGTEKSGVLAVDKIEATSGGYKSVGRRTRHAKSGCWRAF